MREKSDASWEAEQEKARLRIRQIEDHQKTIHDFNKAVHSAVEPLMSPFMSAVEAVIKLSEGLVSTSADRAEESREFTRIGRRISRLMRFAYDRKPWYIRLFIRYNKLYTKIAFRAAAKLTPPSSQA